MAIGILVIAALLLAWTRIDGDESLWHDEAFTALNFIGPGPTVIVSGDYVPNDHIVFNLLTWATTNLLDDHTESSFRLWSTLPALAAIGVLGWWLWRRLSPWTATIFVVLALLSPLHLELARQARGYGIAFLALALLLVSADNAGRNGGRLAWAAFAGVGVVGSYNLPVFVLAFVGVAVAIVVTRPARLRACAITVLAAAGILLALYAPLLTDVLGSTDQEFGAPLPWHAPLTGPIQDLLAPSAELLLDAASAPTWAELVIAALVIAGIARLVLTDRARYAALLLVPVLFTYLALTFLRFFVEPRFTSYLLLPMLVLVAAALAAPIETVTRRLELRALAAIAAAGIAALGVLGTVRIVADAHESAELPIENFEMVGEIIDGAEIGPVITNTIRPEGLRYYLGRDRVAVLSGPYLRQAVCRGTAPFAFVDHPLAIGFEVPSPAPLRCLERRGGVRVQVRQRPERGGHIDVWIVPPRDEPAQGAESGG